MYPPTLCYKFLLYVFYHSRGIDLLQFSQKNKLKATHSFDGKTEAQSK